MGDLRVVSSESESTAESERPRATPLIGPATGRGCGPSRSTVKETYQRSTARRALAERIRPWNVAVASFCDRAEPRKNYVPRFYVWLCKRQ